MGGLGDRANDKHFGWLLCSCTRPLLPYQARADNDAVCCLRCVAARVQPQASTTPAAGFTNTGESTKNRGGVQAVWGGSLIALVALVVLETRTLPAVLHVHVIAVH